MKKRSSNVAPWLLLIFSLGAATAGWWFYFGESATTQRQLEELSTVKAKYISETAELKKRLQQLESKRNNLLQTTQTIKGDFSTLESRLQRLDDQLDVTKTANERLAGELATVTADKKLQDNEVSLIRAESDLLKKELQSADGIRAKLLEEKGQLTAERDKLNAGISQLNNQQDGLQKELDKEKLLLGNNIDALEKDLVLLKTELTSTRTKRDQFLSEKEKTLKERNLLGEQNHKLQSHMTKLQTALTAAEAAKKSAEEDLKVVLLERKHLHAQLQGAGIDLKKSNAEIKKKTTVFQAEKEQLSTILSELEQQLSNEKLSSSVAIMRIKDDYAIITLSVDVLFQPGSARINKQAYSILDKVADSLQKSPNRQINVEGHTDNVPILSARLLKKYPSNWELATARASAAVRYLLKTNKDLSPERLQATGLSEFHPIADNSTAEGRKRNRRIEIKLLPKASINE